MPARRGRPPVRCTDEHPCDRAGTPEFIPAADKPMLEQARSKMAARAAESAPAPRTAANDSLASAMRAKAQLEAVGWVVKGRAWFEERVGREHWAEVVCSRGAESLIIRWQNGVLSTEQYSMEHLNRADNGIPPHSLSFDPNELTDGELVRMVRGMKVTWWNTIASSRETAIIGTGNVAVEHLFVGGGDTDNSKRIIKFLDHSGGGFRAFHVGALLKVG